MPQDDDSPQLTLEDVAALVGVSRTTVSNVVNGTGRVSKDTASKIGAVLQSTGFTVNASARTLRRKSSQLISVLVPIYQDADSFPKENPFYWDFFSGLQGVTHSGGYQILLQRMNPTDEFIPVIRARNLDGVVVVGAYESFAPVPHLLASKIPAIFVDSYLPSLSAHTVNVDDQFGAYLATRYLLGLGHRNIVFVSEPLLEHGVNNERWHGYCQALSENRLAGKPIPIEAQTSLEAGRSLAHRLAYDRSKISAIVTAADILAIGLLRGFHECGVTVPQGMSVIGFDDIRHAQYTVPTLTTIRQDSFGKGEKTGQLLLRLIESHRTGQKLDVQHIQLTPTLVVRESTGPAPAIEA